MKRSGFLAAMITLGMGLAPAVVFAQSVSISRSILPDLPYTVIYPEDMTVTGGTDTPLVLNHPNAPLRCDISIVPVEDTTWTAEAALGALNPDDVTAAWSESLPGFSLVTSGLVDFQDAKALSYEGTSNDSSMSMPLTLVHAETVSNGRGYAMDCVYATDATAGARPIVDFIIANFATRADADCCIGATVDPEPELESTSAQ